MSCPAMSQIVIMLSSPKIHRLRGDESRRQAHDKSTMKTPDEADVAAGNNLRAWRQYREMTQAELAEAVNTTASVIAMIEGGKRQLSPKWLRRLAPALGTRPGWLLEYDPFKLPTDLLRDWDDIPESNREQALKVLSTFKRSA